MSSMELKENIKNTCKSYLEESTIHGVQYTGHSHKHVVYRLVWFLCVCGAFGTLIYHVKFLYEKYHEREYKTKTNVNFIPHFDFPAITFCNSNSFNKNRLNSSTFLYEYFMTLSNSTPSSYSGVLSLNDLKAASFNSEDLFHEMAFQDSKVNITEAMYSWFPWPLMRCFTFNGQWFKEKLTPMKVQNGDPLLMYLNINQDNFGFPTKVAEMSMLIHPPFEPANYHTPSLLLSPGNHYDVKLSMKKYEYLPSPYNSFQNQNCASAGILQSQNLTYFPNYSLHACLMECLSKQIMLACRCATESLVDELINSNVFCTPTQRNKCVLPLMKKFYNFGSNDEDLQTGCNCPRPCSEITYGYEVTSGMFPSTSYLDVLIDRNVTTGLDHARNNLIALEISFRSNMLETISHEASLTLSDVTSDLGGYMGFFIGASVLSVCEIGDVILRIIWTLVMYAFKTKRGVLKTNPTPANK